MTNTKLSCVNFYMLDKPIQDMMTPFFKKMSHANKHFDKHFWILLLNCSAETQTNSSLRKQPKKTGASQFVLCLSCSFFLKDQTLFVGAPKNSDLNSVATNGIAVAAELEGNCYETKIRSCG